MGDGFIRHMKELVGSENPKMTIRFEIDGAEAEKP